MKKKQIKYIIIIIVVLIILLFPIKLTREDGGTVEYKAILYTVRFFQEINSSYESGFYEYREIIVFPFNYFWLFFQ